ncbi:hypothetical protein HDC91_000640 [Mucilaginibacter sp. AK015]|nr:hypothetical protein [Mucilaginibacter sp. AK015]
MDKIELKRRTKKFTIDVIKLVIRSQVGKHLMF